LGAKALPFEAEGMKCFCSLFKVVPFGYTTEVLFFNSLVKRGIRMTTNLFALLLAATAGVAMAVQGSINSVLGKVVGRMEATLIVHVLATIVVGLILLFRFGNGDFSKIPEAPWYVYLGGLINVLIIYGVIAAIPRVGVAPATTAIIVGQVSTALLIDHFGMFGLERICFSWWKGAGLVLLAIGTKLMLN